MAREQDKFAEAVMRRIRDFGRGEVVIKASRSMGESLLASAAATPPMGHPDFMNLLPGEVGSRDAVALFLDLRSFTARSFWDAPEEIIRVNVAVVSELAASVQRHGGYVLGLRGDGVFACFDAAGSVDRRAMAAGVAMSACALALDSVKNALNELLQISGIQPVQVRAGLDLGGLDFVRIGSSAGSEINVLGFAANFASKCEKVALAWEVVAGEALAAVLPNEDLTHHDYSPKQYTRGSETRNYRFFDVKWTRYLQHAAGIANELGGRPVSAIGVL